MGDNGESYKIKENDWLLKIANKYQTTEEKIKEINPSLSELVGGNFNVLQPDIIIKLPGKTSGPKKTIPAYTGRVHTYMKTQKTSKLILMIYEFSPEKFSLDAMIHDDPMKTFWHYQIKIDNKEVEPPLKTESIANFSKITVKSFSTNFENAKLNLTFDPNLEDSEFVEGVAHRQYPFPINLTIGGMEPLKGPRAVKSLQKILSNLGYYCSVTNDNPLLVDLTNTLDSRTRDALRDFQQFEMKLSDYHGYADENTCNALRNKADVNMAWEIIEQKPDEMVLNDDYPYQSLQVNNATTITVDLSPTSIYREPKDPTIDKRVGPIVMYPPQLFVSPTDNSESNTSEDMLNYIKPKSNHIIFLDVGKWLGRDCYFGLVWGRHVYLCKFRGTEGKPIDLSNARAGLDTDFFRQMGFEVSVIKNATAAWAPKEDFNWDKIFVIIPDLHLMTDAISKVWRGKEFQMYSERMLLLFVQKILGLTGEISQKITIVQIGDSYDMWVNIPRLFAENEDLLIKLTEDFPDEYYKNVYGDPKEEQEDTVQGDKEAETIAKNIEDAKQRMKQWSQNNSGKSNPEIIQYLKEVVDDIRGISQKSVSYLYRVESPSLPSGWNWVRNTLHQFEDTDLKSELSVDGSEFWINPATKAFELLDKSLGSNRMIYLHGNHDDYLILPEVANYIGLPYRKAYYSDTGIFMEHGHRMESLFRFELGPRSIAGNFLLKDGQTDPKKNALSGGDNYDGRSSGQIFTNYAMWGRSSNPISADLVNYFDEFGENTAEIHDQPVYWTQFARILMGRQNNKISDNPTHIFVIGHTHKPRLEYIDIGYNGTHDEADYY